MVLFDFWYDCDVDVVGSGCYIELLFDLWYGGELVLVVLFDLFGGDSGGCLLVMGVEGV